MTTREQRERQARETLATEFQQALAAVVGFTPGVQPKESGTLVINPAVLIRSKELPAIIAALRRASE